MMQTHAAPTLTPRGESQQTHAAPTLTRSEILGEGGQAVVYKGKWRGFDIAAKQAKMRRGSSGVLTEESSASAADPQIASVSQMMKREVYAAADSDQSCGVQD